MYKLHMDDKFINITNFNESLDGQGNLTFSVSAGNLDMSQASFTGLKQLKTVLEDNELVLKLTDASDNVIWEDDGYTLSNAQFSASEGGLYFSAYFIQNDPKNQQNAPVEEDM